MSAVLKDEVKQNNLTEGTTSPTQVEVGVGVGEAEEEEDPDAIDETVRHTHISQIRNCFLSLNI
jgi:hypothetical protein